MEHKPSSESEWWEESAGKYLSTSIDVYEDERVKNRAIGFIWPEKKRIILPKRYSP